MQRKKQITVLLMTAVLALQSGSSQVLAAEKEKQSSAVDNTWINTGIGAVDMAMIAETQIGYQASENSKYGEWYYGKQMDASWNAIFVSWCAKQAGISESIVRKNANSGCNKNTIQDNPFGCKAYMYSDTTPCVGDIIFVDSNSDAFSEKVGIVTRIDDSYIYAAEGDINETVEEIKFRRSDGVQVTDTGKDGYILFIGRPAYSETFLNSYPVEYSGTTGNYLINAMGLYVRSVPGQSSDAIGSYLKNNVVEVMEVKDGWGRIDYNGQSGWISLDYCSKLADNEAPVETTSATEAASAETTTEATTVATTEEATTVATTEVTTTATTEESAAATTEELTNVATTEEARIVTTEEATTATTEEATTEATTESATTVNQYTVLADILNVRTGCGTDCELIGYLSKGTEIEVAEVEDGWGKISYQNDIGWVCLDYCKKMEAVTQALTEKNSEATTEITAEITAEATTEITTEATTEITTEATTENTTEATTENTTEAITEITTEAAAETTTQTVTTAVSTSEAVTETTTEAASLNTTAITAETTAATEVEKHVGEEFVIDAGELYIRSSGSTDSDIRGSYVQGNVVTVYEAKNGWGRVKYNDQDGWILLQYCTLLTKTEEQAEKAVNENYIVKAISLYVRSGPSQTADSLGYLQEGDEVVVLEWNGVWGKIKYNGQEVWINTDYCSKK